MNIELLRKVQTKLRRMRHKKHFEMRTFATKNDCGTAFCIAGHALAMSGYKAQVTDPEYPEHVIFVSPAGRPVDPEKAAKRLLRLTEDQMHRLFFRGMWPEKFRGGYCGDPKVFNDPKVGAARIEAFIQTKGKE